LPLITPLFLIFSPYYIIDAITPLRHYAIIAIDYAITLIRHYAITLLLRHALPLLIITPLLILRR
jgi:hypothetical protein